MSDIVHANGIGSMIPKIPEDVEALYHQRVKKNRALFNICRTGQTRKTVFRIDWRGDNTYCTVLFGPFDYRQTSVLLD